MVCADISYLWRILACVEARSTLFEKIWSHQFENNRLYGISDHVVRGESRKDTLDLEGILRFVIIVMF